MFGIFITSCFACLLHFSFKWLKVFGKNLAPDFVLVPSPVNEAFAFWVLLSVLEMWVWGSCESDKPSHTHTFFFFVCFSSEEHALSSGIRWLRYSDVPHISRAVHPLHRTGCQATPGQLLIMCKIMQGDPPPSTISFTPLVVCLSVMLSWLYSFPSLLYSLFQKLSLQSCQAKCTNKRTSFSLTVLLTKTWIKKHSFLDYCRRVFMSDWICIVEFSSDSPGSFMKTSIVKCARTTRRNFWMAGTWWSLSATF